jgi:rifampicin phosphotransferase
MPSMQKRAQELEPFELIADLDAAADLDVAEVGGKAGPLAKARRAGYRVPPGLVVVAGAAEHGIDAVRRELMPRLEVLGAGPFAVRSSAVGEDGAGRSFAGQLETYLQVPRDEVIDAVERCWRSAEALRVLRYAGSAAGAVAVLVQPMIDAQVAGVAFSADPRTGERGVVVIEAVQGLGDRLVSGEDDPERWRLDASGCSRVRGGETDALVEEKALEIGRVAGELESFFGSPQDVEWALREGELFVLQSRPVTALPPAPVPLPVEIPPGGWDRDDHHGVLSPLGWAWFQPYPEALAELFREAGVPLEGIEARRIGGHLYLRFVEGGGGKVPPRWVLWLVSRLLPSLRRAERKARALLDGESYMDDLERWQKEWRPALRRELAELDLPDPTQLSDEALLERIREVLAFTARGLTLHARLHGPGFMSLGKLVFFAEERLGWAPSRVLGLVAGTSGATTELHRQIERIVAAHRGELAESPVVPRSWGELAAQCPKLSSALAEWLQENRLRMLHYDPKHPMLGERPGVVLSVVDSVVAGWTHASADEAAESGADDLLAEAAGRLTPTDQKELLRLVDQARRAYGLREENGIDAVSRPTGLLRHFVLELGRRLGERIGQPERAVYLHPEEHAAALRGELSDLRERIERRLGEESWALANRGPRRVGDPRPPAPPFDAFPSGLSRMMRILELMDRLEAPTAGGEEGALLQGIGSGSRVVTGRARVLRGPEEMARLREGEIVVCRITSPEWSIGLGRVAAIVTDEGGLLSHPAIIAREYGIPAVLGTERATQEISEGDLLRVDPIAGTVTKLG